MRIDAIDIHRESELVADYRVHKDEALKFFDYAPFDSLENRLTDLKNRTFQREALANVLTECNQRWGAADPTFKNIEALKKEETVAVIGGQQAGLLTGPLYSINKVISIIQYARQQEEKLQVPVVPIFWIAGEDHDYEEINHVFMPDQEELRKVKLTQSLYKKTSVSDIALDQTICRGWLDQLFSTLDETEYTKALYHQMQANLESSKSFTDFFARIILDLFKDEGLILIDSAGKEVRALEGSYFRQLVEKQAELSKGVVQAAEQLEHANYPLNMEVSTSDGNIFYHLDNERILLERTESGKWKGKQNEVEFTTEELLHIAETNPEKLSNNVVTRPLMQEMLIPTLAFIAGPGEISYWAALKQAFHTLDLSMPPVIPRISYTYVPVKVNKALEERNMDVETAIHAGVSEKKTAWLREKQDPKIDQVAEDLKRKIEEAHQPIQEIAKELRADMKMLSEKNLFYLHREVDFLRDRMNQALETKFEKELRQFDLLQMALCPGGGFQERKWNPLPFLNQYGKKFITEVTKQSVSFEGKHYVVYL